MSELWTFEVSEVVAAGWPSHTAISIGGTSPDIFVKGRNADTVRHFALSYLEVDHRHHIAAIFWRGWFVFGFGGRVILYREADGAMLEIDLGCYFGEFHPGDDYLLVTSGQGIVRFAPDGAVVWRNDELGLDGVLIFDIEGDVIDGQGEWDPPGGWEDFLVSLATGDTLEELPGEDDDSDA